MGGFSLGNDNFNQQSLDTSLEKNTSLGVVAQNIKEKKKKPTMFTINTKDKKAGNNYDF